MRFSHRLFLLLILLLTGAPILAQEPSDVAKNVRMMVSGIVSYTRWPGLSGPPKLCIFSSSRFSTALQENAATSLPYLPVIIHTQQEAMNGETIGEVRLTARDSSISHFIWFSLAVLTGCILLASGIAITLTRHLHNGLVEALKNITDVVHDVRSNRNFSRRVSEERIAEFHRFALDFNSLLDEMEEWQLRLQAKNAQLLRTALHDPLTGLANRAAFRSGINTLMNNSDARKTSALLFLDGDNFKYINDTWVMRRAIES